MLYLLWLKRVLLSPKNIFEASAVFSAAGLSLAAAALTTALLVVNGFTASLEKAIVDRSGRLSVLSDGFAAREELERALLPHQDLIREQAAFLSFEGIILRGGKFKGAFFEGADEEHLKNSSFLRRRILKGEISGKKPFVIIGRALAKELKADIGSPVSVVMAADRKSPFFSRKQKTFFVSAIADFGRHDFNSRYVLTSLADGEALLGSKGLVSGIRVWLKQKGEALPLARQMRREKAGPYHIVHWKDMDRWFFKVIEMDKKIIFFVLFIMIIAAGFNVSSALFVHVFRKTREISILKAMGAAGSTIRNIFLLEGLVLGALGLSSGVFLGWGIVSALIYAQNKWHFIPEEVYQVNEIVLYMDPQDMAVLLLASLAVIALASLIPARRAYKKDIKEGLAHE